MHSALEHPLAFLVRPDPEPRKEIAFARCQSTIGTTDPHRLEHVNLFEPKRAMERGLKEQLNSIPAHVEMETISTVVNPIGIDAVGRAFDAWRSGEANFGGPDQNGNGER